VSWDWTAGTDSVEPMEFVVDEEAFQSGAVQGGAQQMHSVPVGNSSSQGEDTHQVSGGGVLSDGEQYSESSAVAAPASPVTPAAGSAAPMSTGEHSNTGLHDMISSSKEAPHYFRSLNEIYQETSEIKLNSESDI